MSDKKRNASQRIEDLEQALMAAYQTLNQMAGDLSTIKEAIKLLGNKSDAVAKAAGLSDDVISAIMVDNNVAELKSKTDNLVTSGVLSTVESIAADSFVIGKEVDDDGKVVNPRLQFALSSLNQDLQDKLVGAKVGDVVTLQEGKLKLEVMEVYKIATQESAPVATEEVETEVSAAAGE